MMNPTLGALLALFFCLLPPSSPLMHPLWRVAGMPGPPRESVAEAGIFAPQILGLRGGGWDKSWKGMVQEAEADYDIMQSPLTTEEEIRHIQSMRKAAPMTDEERAKFNTPKVPGVPQPRPATGPNGTYGDPDLTGLRWKTLRAGEGTMPYPRVPARLMANSSLAEQDPYMSWLKRYNVSADEDLDPTGPLTEDQLLGRDSGDSDDEGLYNIAHCPDPNKFTNYWKPPVPNMTMGSHLENEDGYLLQEIDVSPNWRPWSAKAAVPLPQGTRCAAWGDNRASQLGLGEPRENPEGAVPQYARDESVGAWKNGWPADSWGKDEQFSEQIPLPLDSALGLEAGDSIFSLSAGWNHVFAIVEMARTGMRKVMSWGFNDEGQLGLGHCDDVIVPTLVDSLADVAKDIVQVSCGQEHTVVLLSNGSMLACGSLEHGSTGTGEPMLEDTCSPYFSPVVATPFDEKVVSICCGDFHTVFLGEGGGLWTSGLNCCGQLGVGTNINSSIPLRVESFGPVTMVACGSEHTVVYVDGERGKELWAWGRNEHGQVGNKMHPHMVWPNCSIEAAPVRMVYDKTQPCAPVRQIACGDEHTVILFEDGTLWGCGFNFMGQLGLAHGADAFMLTPLTESQGGHWASWCEDGASTSFVRISCGDDHTAAVTRDGQVILAGDNDFGELGKGNYFKGHVPAPVQALSPRDWRVECLAHSTFVWLPLVD